MKFILYLLSISLVVFGGYHIIFDKLLIGYIDILFIGMLLFIFLRIRELEKNLKENSMMKLPHEFLSRMEKLSDYVDKMIHSQKK